MRYKEDDVKGGRKKSEEKERLRRGIREVRGGRGYGKDGKIIKDNRRKGQRMSLRGLSRMVNKGTFKIKTGRFR